MQDLAYYAVPVENLTRTVGCWSTSGWTSSTILPCLRALDQATLFAAAPSQVWNPLVDGTFLTGYPSSLLGAGQYNAVPLLTGTNSDEGTGFSPSGAPDTEADLFHALLWWRGYALSPPTVRRLLALYPDDPCHEPPLYITNCSVFASKGLAWRRGAAIGGDMVIHSGRRKMCEVYAAGKVAVYSYRFDTRLYGEDPLLGVPHFDNVAFSFQNITGALGPSPVYDDARRLATSIGAAYVRFVHHLDPNPLPAGKEDDDDDDVLAKEGGLDALALPAWPAYRLDAPTNMVLNATGPWVEADTWRKEGIAYMNTYDVARELLA